VLRTLSVRSRIEGCFVSLVKSVISFLHAFLFTKSYDSRLTFCTEICLDCAGDRALIVLDPADVPEECLKRTKTCVERVQRITSPTSSTLLRFNPGQCKYLADKLKLAVKSADSFLVLLNKKDLYFPSKEDEVNCLKIFKLLYASAKEVEDFIQSHCSKDAWIQAAMSLTNVSE
jgi:hypothetical protein